MPSSWKRYQRTFFATYSITDANYFLPKKYTTPRLTFS